MTHPERSVNFRVQKYHFGIPWGRTRDFNPGEEIAFVSHRLAKHIKTTLTVTDDGKIIECKQTKPRDYGALWSMCTVVNILDKAAIDNLYGKGSKFSTRTRSTTIKVSAIRK
jgi:hypothetical protein